MSRNMFLALILFCALGVQAQQISVVNGAGFGATATSPGSWVTAFGAFAGVTATTASAFPLPKTLAGVTVKVDGVDAPIYFANNQQVNFLIPYATAPGIRPVSVATGGGTFNGTVRVLASAPGLFTKDTATPPRAAVRNQDGVTENASGTPTRRGDIISIYGTGPGPLSRTPADGAAPGGPSATTTGTPQVFIGGVETTVQFSGLNADAPGLWQINAVVPNRPFITGRVAVQVFMNGLDSNEVAIFVQ